MWCSRHQTCCSFNSHQWGLAFLITVLLSLIVSRTILCPLFLLQVRLLVCLLSAKQRNQVILLLLFWFTYRCESLFWKYKCVCLFLFVQRRRRGRRGATTSNKGSGRTSPLCWRRRWIWQSAFSRLERFSLFTCILIWSLIGRTCQRRRSLTTCLLWPHPPLYLPVTSAASAGFPLTTPVPPAGGATAAASVWSHTEKPGKHTHTCLFLYVYLKLYGDRVTYPHSDVSLCFCRCLKWTL